jgi:hypothetical protein
MRQPLLFRPNKEVRKPHPYVRFLAKYEEIEMSYDYSYKPPPPWRPQRLLWVLVGLAALFILLQCSGEIWEWLCQSYVVAYLVCMFIGIANVGGYIGGSIFGVCYALLWAVSLHHHWKIVMCGCVLLTIGLLIQVEPECRQANGSHVGGSLIVLFNYYGLLRFGDWTWTPEGYPK